MADLGRVLPDRQVVLQVAAAEAGVADVAVAALVEELAGQAEVGLVAGLAVQLGQRGLDDGVAVVAFVAQEVIDQVVGEPRGHGEQRVGGGLEVRRGGGGPGRFEHDGGAVRGDRGLDQVAGAVQLVAGGQLGVAGLAGDLDVGVQVTVGLLGLHQEIGCLGRERGQRGVAGRPGLAGQLPGDRLQGLVDVGVHERRAAVGRRVAARDGQAQVAEVAGRLHLGHGQRKADLTAALLPVVQQAAGQAGSRAGHGPVHHIGGRRRAYRPAQLCRVTHIAHLGDSSGGSEGYRRGIGGVPMGGNRRENRFS